MASFNQAPLGQTSLTLTAAYPQQGTDTSTAVTVPAADKRTTFYVKPDWRRNPSLLR